MKRFGVLAQHLFRTTPGVSNAFSNGRFEVLSALNKELAAVRNPDLKITHDYRPEEAIKMFVGW